MLWASNEVWCDLADHPFPSTSCRSASPVFWSIARQISRASAPVHKPAILVFGGFDSSRFLSFQGDLTLDAIAQDRARNPTSGCESQVPAAYFRPRENMVGVNMVLA